MSTQILDRPTTTSAVPNFPTLTALLTLMTLVVAALPGVAPMLATDTTTFATPWHWITCHFVHWNFEHLFWSGGTFLALGILCERQCPRAFRWALASSLLLIPPVLIALRDTSPVYGGLSGVDSALFVLYGVDFLRAEYLRGDRRLVGAAGALLLGFLGKVGYEAFSGVALFANTPEVFVPVPLAHLTGGVLGFLAALGFRSARQF